MLTLIERLIEKDKHGFSMGLFKCSCGNNIKWQISKVNIGYKKHCGCIPKPKKNKAHNTIDLTGQKFGKLTVIKDSGQRKDNGRKIVWICKCDCGNDHLSTSHDLKFNHNPGCGCGRHRKSWNNSTIGELTGLFWSHIKTHAKRRKLKIEITQQQAWDLFLKQNKKCKYTGIKLSFNPQTASLDRIDSKKNYTLNNIQWIHKKINLMKWKIGEEKFLNYCKLIKENYNKIFIRENFKIYNHNGCWNSKFIGELGGLYFAQIKWGAKDRNIEFNLTQEEAWQKYLDQKGLCAYTKLPLTLYVNWKSPGNRIASLDRIDNSKGYVKNNIQWVYKDINLMKRDMKEKVFIQWCKLITNYMEKNNAIN